MTTPELETPTPAVEILSAITPQDVQDFKRLLAQLSSKPLPESSVIEERLNLAINPENPDSCVVVIRDQNGMIQATATGNICRIPTGAKSWIDDVVTDREYRGRGYGRQLMEALHSWFEERGVDSVNLTSKPIREKAGGLYESMGYIPRDTRVYRKSLGQTALSEINRP